MEDFENNNVMENEETVAVDTAVETDRPDLGGYAILGLAGVGAGFLAKKAFDLGKTLYGKCKAKIAEKKAAKAAAAEPAKETKSDDAAPQETEE